MGKTGKDDAGIDRVRLLDKTPVVRRAVNNFPNETRHRLVVQG